jgi:hypothetical protein
MKRRTLLLPLFAILAGCAAPAPIPFQLIDNQRTYTGSFKPGDQSIDILIGDKPFHGFYVVARGTTVTTVETPFARRFRSYQTITSSTSNSARALLTAADGEKITCAFLFEDKRAVGDCKSSKGTIYQFVASE